MKQRDDDAADAASSRQHIRGEDDEPAMAAAHHFDKARHWLTSLQSIQQRGEQSAQNAQIRGRPSAAVSQPRGARPSELVSRNRRHELVMARAIAARSCARA